MFLREGHVTFTFQKVKVFVRGLLVLEGIGVVEGVSEGKLVVVLDLLDNSCLDLLAVGEVLSTLLYLRF